MRGSRDFFQLPTLCRPDRPPLESGGCPCGNGRSSCASFPRRLPPSPAKARYASSSHQTRGPSAVRPVRGTRRKGCRLRCRDPPASSSRAPPVINAHLSKHGLIVQSIKRRLQSSSKMGLQRFARVPFNVNKEWPNDAGRLDGDGFHGFNLWYSVRYLWTFAVMSARAGFKRLAGTTVGQATWVAAKASSQRGLSLSWVAWVCRACFLPSSASSRTHTR